MTFIRDAWFAFMIAIFGVTAVTIFLPYIPIDETRYLSVAWEMRLNHSFIVPLLNGLPYSNKPPLLFWLIDLDWWIFGVNETTLRFLPLLFNLLNIALVYKISMRIWNDKRVARYAAIIFSSTLICLIWSALIMFDVILTFWVLLGILGLLMAATDTGITPWMLISLSVGGGILTKGPVIFIHIIPMALLCSLWIPAGTLNLKRWFSRLVPAVSAGIVISLLWVIPAAIMGGDIYRKDLLWAQTANRVVASFAHQRPLWWYLPLVPGLLFPWFFVKPAWLNRLSLKSENGIRFLLIWMFSTLLLFSLISGKQIHYLIPTTAAGCLLMARNLAICDPTHEVGIKHHYPIAVLYIAIGIVLFMLPGVKQHGDAGHISFGMVKTATIGFIVLGGVMLSMKISSMDHMIKTIALSSLIALTLIVVSGKNGLFVQHDVKTVSQMLKEKQLEGYKILNYGEYDGQYQFLGRLQQPLIIVKNRHALNNYLKTSGKVILITYEKPSKFISGKDILYQQLYRNKKLVVWKKAGINDFLASISP